MEHGQIPGHRDTHQDELNRRLEDIGWALFLVMVGVLWLLPDERVPDGAWLIGAGLIMLGLNGARYLTGIKMSSFTVILGLLALAGGLAAFLGVDLPLFPMLLILVGASIILKPLIAAQG